MTQARLIQIRGSREYQLLLREIEEIKKAKPDFIVRGFGGLDKILRRSK